MSQKQDVFRQLPCRINIKHDLLNDVHVAKSWCDRTILCMDLESTDFI